jgi:hypothetical protein
MTLNFTTTPSPPVPITGRVDIIVAGSVIGTITPVDLSSGKKMHAIIKVATDSSTDPYLLMQGFGDTHELAVADAIAKGGRAIADLAVAYDAIAKTIGAAP